MELPYVSRTSNLRLHCTAVRGAGFMVQGSSRQGAEERRVTTIVLVPGVVESGRVDCNLNSKHRSILAGVLRCLGPG